MTDEYSAGYLDGMIVRIPAGQLGEFDELVPAAIFLASDAASYVAGVVLPVDGGLLTT
jgi:NAD(P)-dependent dehydrogenase (short-subunit alcohol dehydrogenase family)